MPVSGIPIQDSWPILRTQSIRLATPSSEASIERIFQTVAQAAGPSVKATRHACNYTFMKNGEAVAALMLWPAERIFIGFCADHRKAIAAAEKLASRLSDQVRQHTLQKQRFYFVAVACGEDEEVIADSLLAFLKAA